MRTPKKIWIIFDPLDGTHLFHSEEAANKMKTKWKKEEDSSFESVWDMSEVLEYTRKETKT